MSKLVEFWNGDCARPVSRLRSGCRFRSDSRPFPVEVIHYGEFYGGGQKLMFDTDLWFPDVIAKFTTNSVFSLLSIQSFLQFERPFVVQAGAQRSDKSPTFGDKFVADSVPWSSKRNSSDKKSTFSCKICSR